MGHWEELRYALKSLASEPFGLFFFQAKDGIRDGDVTGVQTCALPISLVCARPSCTRANEGGGRRARSRETPSGWFGSRWTAIVTRCSSRSIRRDRPATKGLHRALEIGRASCRERG